MNDMIASNFTLTLLPDTLAICRLEADSEMPSWATAGDFFSITRTADELSVICLQGQVSEGIRCESGFRCYKVDGPLDFGLTGILASLTTVLAQAGISILAFSTFDTDYLLVKEEQLEKATETLLEAGYSVIHGRQQELRG